MASPAARKRLSKEYAAMQKTPPPFAWAVPDEKNILNWHFILRGPPDSPYDGGEYYGMIMFPGDYPFKPPDIKMITPSGRFQPEKKICTSMTSFHPSTWNPAWSVATILTGLLSFMLSDEITTGAINTTMVDKVAFASKSHAFNLSNKKFKEMFPDYCTPQPKPVPDMGVAPTPSVPGSNAPPGESKSVSTPSSSSLSSLSDGASAVARAEKKAAVAVGGAGAAATGAGGAGEGAGARRFSTWRWVAVVLAAVVVGRLSSLLARDG